MAILRSQTFVVSSVPAVALVCIAAVLAAPSAALAVDIVVGPGKEFVRIEDAVARAKPGDRVLVCQRENNAPYERVAVRLNKPGISIIASEPGVRLSGESGDYSGIGSVPRAIVQFDPGSDGSSIAGFELAGARNASNNGAGVRINQADDVSVLDCDIHHNDMGIMSNGDNAGDGASRQLFQRCHIHHNGAIAEEGYSHNLYLGGVSATLSDCIVECSTAGHNVKSRARLTTIVHCLVRDSANREIDLVDAAGFTDRPDSGAAIINSVIIKRADSKGNRAVIHFGRDGGSDRMGCLRIVSTIIVTHYATPVVTLTTPHTSVETLTSLVVNTSHAGRCGPLSRVDSFAERALSR